MFSGDCECGARRIDNQIGLERTPEEYVAALVAVFAEVRRVLRDDGTVWINLGDSYASGEVGRHDSITTTRVGPEPRPNLSGKFLGGERHQRRLVTGLKPKDLVGIPWSVAKALQAPYYTGHMKSEGDRRWIAAMIDGEGTIGGFHHIRADDGRPRTGVNVYITNGSTALLNEADRIWPASRSEHMKPGPGHLGTIPVYRWIVHGTANKTLFIREVYPHLIEKKRQALIAYNLLLLMADAKRLGHTPQRDAVRAKRKVLTDLISSLNQRRSVDLPAWLEEPPSCYEPGWYLRSDIIWAKPNPMPESVTDRPTKAHEYIFLLAKAERYYYDAEAIKEVATTDGPWGGRNPRAGIDVNGGGQASVRNFGHGLTHRNRRSVWTVATAPYPEAHFATFPPDLIKPCVLAGSRPGDTVLDPFAGSGTTLYVAKELGRQGIGIELNEKYCELAERRLRQEVLQF